MGLPGYVETLFEWMAALLQFLGLIHKQIRGQNHTIAYDVDLAPLEDTRRNGTKYILLAFKLQCMSGIRTALKPSHDIILRCQHINNLPFAFIAPLET